MDGRRDRALIKKMVKPGLHRPFTWCPAVICLSSRPSGAGGASAMTSEGPGCYLYDKMVLVTTGGGGGQWWWQLGGGGGGGGGGRLDSCVSKVVVVVVVVRGGGIVLF